MSYRENFEKWLSQKDKMSQKDYAILEEMAKDEALLKESFSIPLSFGTAGMRGIIGYGTNKMNVYTVRRATQGLADFIKAKPSIF